MRATLEKIDMIHCKISLPGITEELLQIFLGLPIDSFSELGIIVTQKIKEGYVISCISSESRDSLFLILQQSIAIFNEGNGKS